MEEVDFLGGVAVPVGAEVADIAMDHRRSGLRRHATRSAALVIVIGLHAGVLALWRSAPPPTSRDISADRGSGGISLSLVSGRSGGFFAESTANAGVEASTAIGRDMDTPSPTGASPMLAEAGKQGADAAPAAEGHSDGGAGAGAQASERASVGSGYDPGAYASLAPASFSHVSQPGFWEQVQRCYHGASSSGLTLTVVLDEAGVFIDAYPDRGSVITSQTHSDAQAMTEATQALKACSPYHGLPGGLASRLTLVVPGSINQQVSEVSPKPSD